MPEDTEGPVHRLIGGDTEAVETIHVGRHVVEQLVSHGIDVTAVNRTGRGEIAGAQIVAGDATDPAFTREVSAGADEV